MAAMNVHQECRKLEEQAEEDLKLEIAGFLGGDRIKASFIAGLISRLIDRKIQNALIRRELS
jgi:hypothetical protein